MHWSCPHILAIACTTLMYEIDSCGKKRTRMQSFWAFFLVKFSSPENMPKVVGLTAIFSSIYGFMMRPFAEHILFYFWKTQTQHFIARKQSSKPNARGQLRNNKHKTTTYLPTFLSLLNLIHCLFCNFIGFCNSFDKLLNKIRIIIIFVIQRLWFQVVHFVCDIVIENIIISLPFHELPFFP